MIGGDVDEYEKQVTFEEVGGERYVGGSLYSW
jgi:hypothetical protein